MISAVQQTPRYTEKRDRIIDAAAQVINSDGVRGMTFVAVAAQLGMTTTSITYYFKRREHLIEAAMGAAIDGLDAMAVTALAEKGPRARIASLIAQQFEMRRAIRAGERLPPARLAEVRALDDDVTARLNQHYVEMLRKVRQIFVDIPGLSKSDAVIRTHLLVENLFWLDAWIASYTRADFARIKAQLLALLCDGIVRPSSAMAAALADRADEEQFPAPEPGVEAFLSVATRLINQRGYRGASVDRIAGELNVTKGSFYHHLGGKDDLLLACFERSYARQSAAQHRAIAKGGTGAEVLVRALDSLLADQFGERHELLRSTALEMLVPDLRQVMMSRSHRVARRFAGMLVDAMADGSVAVCDPMIAAQLLMVGINSAVELRGRATGADSRDYMWVLIGGLLAR